MTSNRCGRLHADCMDMAERLHSVAVMREWQLESSLVR